MAQELEQSLKKAAEKVAQYVSDVSELTVKTNYVIISEDGSGDFDNPKLAAQTTINLDGDSETTVPMRKATDANGGETLEIDMPLFALHESNVETAITYRAEMLASLLDLLKDE
ncbi:MAG TPA: hypothetical protein VLL52_08345 [Anaerolineae bacterium]|nr:hypothetical protein [Anaerolineae bacterium]